MHQLLRVDLLHMYVTVSTELAVHLGDENWLRALHTGDGMYWQNGEGRHILLRVGGACISAGGNILHKDMQMR